MNFGQRLDLQKKKDFNKCVTRETPITVSPRSISILFDMEWRNVFAVSALILRQNVIQLKTALVDTM